MATLTITGKADLDSAQSDVLSLGEAVRNLGDEIKNDVTFDSVGESADNVASRASQATGALGALAGGLDAVGATGAAETLQQFAVASDALSGAADLVNLAVETQTGQLIISKAATIVSTAATEAFTVAQGALNAVMALNPIALVVIALVALVAGIVLAYQHSETFRNIVDGAFTRAKDVVEDAVSAIEDIVGWFKDLPGEAKDAWNAVSNAVGDAIGIAVDDVTGLVDDVTRLPREAVSTVAGAFSDMFAPIQTAIGWVQDLIDKIGSIHFPHIDIPGLPRVDLGDSGTPTRPDQFTQLTGGVFGPTLSISLTSAPQDKDKSIADLLAALQEYFARRGQTLQIVSP